MLDPITSPIRAVSQTLLDEMPPFPVFHVRALSGGELRCYTPADTRKIAVNPGTSSLQLGLMLWLRIERGPCLRELLSRWTAAGVQAPISFDLALEQCRARARSQTHALEQPRLKDGRLGEGGLHSRRGIQ